MSYSKTVPVPEQRRPGLRKQEINQTIWLKTYNQPQSNEEQKEKQPEFSIINSPFSVTYFQSCCYFKGRQTCLGNKNSEKLRRKLHMLIGRNLTIQNEIQKISKQL